MPDPEQLNGDVDDPAVDDLEPVEDAGEGAAGGEPDPAAELRAQLAEEREARIRLEERLAARDAEAKKNAPTAPAPQHYTHAQLRAAVDEGKISEDQLVEIWSRQQRELAVQEADARAEQREKQREAERAVGSEYERYLAAHPDLHDKTSEAWRRVKREYDYLKRLGDPDNATTELKALRAALGPVDRIRERTSRLRETGSDGGSRASGGEPNRDASRNVDIFNRIPHKYRGYYKGRYENGTMTLKEIEKDLPYMKRLS